MSVLRKEPKPHKTTIERDGKQLPAMLYYNLKCTHCTRYYDAALSYDNPCYAKDHYERLRELWVMGCPLCSLKDDVKFKRQIPNFDWDKWTKGG